MEVNCCEVSSTTPHVFDTFSHKDNFESNISPSEMYMQQGFAEVSGNNKKLHEFLTSIMNTNLHHLELFKSKNLPASFNCGADTAVKIFFGWSVGVNIKELSEYLEINEDVAKHFYLLSTLYAKKYIRNHMEEFRIGGSGVVVLLDVYPGGCSKFNYETTNRNNSVLCMAEIKSIPTKYWFQILSQPSTNSNQEEILSTLRTMVRSGSILVIDFHTLNLTEESIHMLKRIYHIVVSIESLRHHDTEQQILLNNLETIWKPALDICEFGNYHGDVSSYYTSFLWNQRFGNDNLRVLLNEF